MQAPGLPAILVAAVKIRAPNIQGKGILSQLATRAPSRATPKPRAIRNQIAITKTTRPGRSLALSPDKSPTEAVGSPYLCLVVQLLASCNTTQHDRTYTNQNGRDPQGN